MQARTSGARHDAQHRGLHAYQTQGLHGSQCRRRVLPHTMRALLQPLRSCHPRRGWHFGHLVHVVLGHVRDRPSWGAVISVTHVMVVINVLQVVSSIGRCDVMSHLPSRVG